MKDSQLTLEFLRVSNTENHYQISLPDLFALYLCYIAVDLIKVQNVLNLLFIFMDVYLFVLFHTIHNGI